MSHDEQLAWEARAGKPAAVAAFAAAIMALASGIYLQLALHDYGDGTAEVLRSADREPGDFVVAGVLQAVGLLLLIPVLLYLYRASRYRREQTMPAAAVLVVLGGLTLAIVVVLQKLEFIDIAHGFHPGAKVKDLDQAAKDEVKDNISAALQGVGLGGAVAFAFSMVMISLNAMRAGLLSRFMGVLGIIIGVLLVIPILPLPVVQLFWFTAVGLLFLDRWPGGRGPAWQTGEEIPWPGAAEQRDEIVRRRAERTEPDEPEPDEPEPEPEPQAPRPASRKRRKKRR